MSVLVKTSNISKIYHPNKENKVIALSDINLTIEQGEFVVVMGPSGAGKSTLLSVLSTILEPTSGEVIIDGKKISEMDELARSRFRYKELGFIYQDYNLIDSLTIYENIALPLSLADDSRQEINQKVNETANHLGIEMILNKYPNECSGGQLQRVAIARTLANSPKLIVADEPTGNLDSVNSHEVMKLLSELNDEGTTIVLVTHDSTIASYGDRLLYINDGVLEKELLRGTKNKKAYFNEIVDINSKEIFFEEDI